MSCGVIAAIPRLAAVAGRGELVDPETGECLNPREHRVILAEDVTALPRQFAPTASFQLTVKRDGDVVQAIGPVTGRKLSLCYPGAVTWSDALDSEDALRAAQLTRGLTPPGRAFDLAMRMVPKARQWRVRSVFMRAFQQALYGGLQVGGVRKPDLTRPPQRAGMGWYQADIASSYPALAVGPLPTIPSAVFSRGMHRDAVLWYLAPVEQYAPHLWRRDQYGNPYMDDCLAGWYVREEVEHLVDSDYLDRQQLRIRASVRCQAWDDYLTPVIAHLFAAKEREREERRRLPVKVALNGLLGRFGSRLSPWRPKRADDAPGRASWLYLGNNVLVWDRARANAYPSGANVLWTAMVTARGRVRLREKCQEIHRAGGTVLWAHTDAVIAEVPDSYVPRDAGDALGAWRTLTRTYSQGGNDVHHQEGPGRQSAGAA